MVTCTGLTVESACFKAVQYHRERNDLMKTLTAVLLVVFAIITTGCGQEAPPPVTTVPSPGVIIEQPETQQPSAGLVFRVNGVTIRMGEPVIPVLEALGEPLDRFEAPSCAFDGIDRIFFYRGFELFTYPVGDEDFILSVSLTDDSVTTTAGVYLGMTYEDMTAAHGEDYVQNLGQYTYTQGQASLSFIIENDEITAIIYNYLV